MRFVKTRMTAIAFFAASAVMSSGMANATTCLQDDYDAYVWGNGQFYHKTQSVGDQQAANTYQDWIWVGPELDCPHEGVQNCPLSLTQSHTSTYWHEAGFSLGPTYKGLGGEYAGTFSANWGWMQSYTLAQTFGGNLLPGWSGTMVQYVIRRWHSGHLVGAWQNNGRHCDIEHPNYTGKGMQYNWNASYTDGKRWSAYRAEGQGYRIHTWKN